MDKYRCEVAYRTKRGGVCLGMTISAANGDEALEKATVKTLKGYPARKLAWARVEVAERDTASSATARTFSRAALIAMLTAYEGMESYETVPFSVANLRALIQQLIDADTADRIAAEDEQRERDNNSQFGVGA